MPKSNVLLFGTFDPLHEGHRAAFREAKSFGETLTVVVARDTYIQSKKHRQPHMPQEARLGQVARDPSVDHALLGDEDPSSYATLMTVPLTILALGYDQSPSDGEVRALLDQRGLSHVAIRRLSPYMPHVYKSSLLRPS
jgi:cytidyltransferase-like protein